MSKVSVYLRLSPSNGNTCVSPHGPTTLLVDGVPAFECSGFWKGQVPLHGEDVVVMAYGHSGSGKTHTIFGESLPSGSFVCSFLEVYKEKAYDLLKSGGPPLPLRDNGAHQRAFVPGLTRVAVQSKQELLALVEIGLGNRATGPNGTHDRSSRSHAILELKSVDRGTVWLVDLAGSEKRQVAKQQEGVAIQQSLLSLRRCVEATKGFVPIRSSVLTRLLFSKKCSSIIIIACISPDRQHLNETLATLEFASVGLKHWPDCEQPFEVQGSLRRALSELRKVREELEYEKHKTKQLEYQVMMSSRIDMSHVTSPVMSPVLSTQGTTQLDESIMSKTWRHNQYDAILKRCWGN